MSAAVSDYYVVIPLPLLDAPGAALKVYAILRSYLNPAEPERSEVWPARKTIATRAGTSVDTVDRAVTWLVENGWLLVEQRRDAEGDLTSNRYTIFGSQRGSRKVAAGGGRKDAATVAANQGYEVEPVEVKTKAQATTRALEFSSIAADPQPTTRRKPARPIPENYQPDPDLVAWTKATTPDIDMATEWANFCDHALATDRRMVDWRRAWMTWARKAKQFKQDRQTPRRGIAQPETIDWSNLNEPIDYAAAYEELNR